MYQAAIFDLDGTLLNTIRDIANAANFALVELGLPIHSPESYKYMVGPGKTKLIDDMLPEGQKSSQPIALQLFDSFYSRHLMDETIPYPGIHEMLSELKKNRIRLAVLTNKAQEAASRMIDHFFPQLFDKVVGVDHATLPKPDPTELCNLLAEWAIDPRQVLYIGDSGIDVVTGKSAGVDTAGAAWGFRGIAELESQSPTYIVNTADELKNLILK